MSRVAALLPQLEENTPVEQEIYDLSSGTIANLTGLKKNASIDRFQVALANWAHKNDSKDWKEAFKSWMEHLGVTVDRMGNADPAELKDKIGDIMGEDYAQERDALHAKVQALDLKKSALYRQVKYTSDQARKDSLHDQIDKLNTQISQLKQQLRDQRLKHSQEKPKG